MLAQLSERAQTGYAWGQHLGAVPPLAYRSMLEQLPNIDEVDQHLLLQVMLGLVPGFARGAEGGKRAALATLAYQSANSLGQNGKRGIWVASGREEAEASPHGAHAVLLRSGLVQHCNSLLPGCHVSGINFFVNRMLAGQLAPDAPGALSVPLAEGVPAGERLPNQADHRDANNQPPYSWRLIFHLVFRHGGASSATTIHMASGSVTLSTGGGQWCLIIDAEFLACHLHAACVLGPHPQRVSAVVNLTPVHSLRPAVRVAALPSVMPALPSIVEGRPAADWLQSYEARPNVLVCNFHDMEEVVRAGGLADVASMGYFEDGRSISAFLKGCLALAAFLERKGVAIANTEFFATIPTLKEIGSFVQLWTLFAVGTEEHPLDAVMEWVEPNHAAWRYSLTDLTYAAVTSRWHRIVWCADRIVQRAEQRNIGCVEAAEQLDSERQQPLHSYFSTRSNAAAVEQQHGCGWRGREMHPVVGRVAQAVLAQMAAEEDGAALQQAMALHERASACCAMAVDGYTRY